MQSETLAHVEMLCVTFQFEICVCTLAAMAGYNLHEINHRDPGIGRQNLDHFLVVPRSKSSEKVFDSRRCRIATSGAWGQVAGLMPGCLAINPEPGSLEVKLCVSPQCILGVSTLIQA